jgi:hypothetical protein
LRTGNHTTCAYIMIAGWVCPAHGGDEGVPLQGKKGDDTYEAVPHGDMMLAGCFGLLRAVAACHPELAPAIEGVIGLPVLSAAGG